jgi:hypothetical protein
MGLGVVRRADSSLGNLEALYQAVDSVGFQRVLDGAMRAGEERELVAEVWRPIRTLIAQDEAASSALQKLIEVRRVADDAALRRGTWRRDAPGDHAWGPPQLHLRPGVSIFTPPYDLERSGPKYGLDSEAEASADRGTLHVEAPFLVDTPGARGASATISIALEASRKGTLLVRPFTTYHRLWVLFGYLLSAHAEGRLTLTAVNHMTGNVEDAREYPLFDWTTQTGWPKDDSHGVAWPPSFEVRVLVEPKVRYVFSITASVAGDQSGDPPFPAVGASIFAASLDVSVPWITAELR